MSVFRISLLFRCRRANALIEFALVLPLLLVMLLGLIEFARYAVLQQKLDKTVFAMADFTTQSDRVSERNLRNFVDAIPEIMRPFDFHGSIIFNSVSYSNVPLPGCPTPNVTCIAWQRSFLGADTSRLGAPGGPAALPANYSMRVNKDLIVTELYYDYSPLMIDFIDNFVPAFRPHQIYKVAVYRPRLHGLTELQP